MEGQRKQRRETKRLDAEQLWNYALNSLSRRAHSQSEIRRKLVARAASLSDIDPTVAKLVEYRLVDDNKFSETFASVRVDSKKHGKQRVMRDLRAKQVPERVASEAIEKTYANVDEQQLIADYLERKFRNKNLREYLKDQKNMASAYRRLRLAGFASRLAIETLKRYASLPEDWSEPEEPESE